jgi:hypothetical protein
MGREEPDEEEDEEGSSTLITDLSSWAWLEERRLRSGSLSFSLSLSLGRTETGLMGVERLPELVFAEDEVVAARGVRSVDFVGTAVGPVGVG